MKVVEILKDKIYQINNFLTDNECDEYITYMNEQEKNRETTRYTKEGKYFDAINDKENDNIYKILGNYKELLNKLDINYEKSKSNLAVSRYPEGSFFEKHYDLPRKKSNKTNTYKLLVYLNDNFKGGETIYYYNDKIIKVKPQKGKALIFNLDLYHEGSKIEKGEKYIIGYRLYQ